MSLLIFLLAQGNVPFSESCYFFAWGKEECFSFFLSFFKFQVHRIIIQHLYRAITITNLVTIHLHTVDPLYPFHPPVMPSLLVTTSLFSVSMGLSLFHLVCSFVLVLFYIPHMSEIVQCLSFFI